MRAAGVCTHTVAHTVVTTTWVRNTFKTPHARSILISPTMSRSTSMLTTTCQISESLLLGFPRQARLLILGDVFVKDLHLSVCGPQSTIFNFMINQTSHSSFSGSRSSRHLFLLDTICGFLPASFFMLTVARVVS